MDTASLMKFQVWLLQQGAHEERVRADTILVEILLAALAMVASHACRDALQPNSSCHPMIACTFCRLAMPF